MPINLVDTAALRQRGRHNEADVLDKLELSTDSSGLGLGGGQGVGSAVTQPHQLHASLDGPSSSGSTSAVSSARDSPDSSSMGNISTGDRASGTASSVAGGVGLGDSDEGAESASAEPTMGLESHQQSDVHADPLAGIHNEDFRAYLTRQAFISANADAQDSEIVRHAGHLLPPELRAVIRHAEPRCDITPTARAARIENLKGAIPDWARKDLESNPAEFHAREPSPVKPVPSRVVVPASKIPSRTAAKRATGLPPAEPSIRPPRIADSDRER